MSNLAYFAAGCFWGVEEKFRQTQGVLETAVGYSGGHATNPTYQSVCSGNTRHAETVCVTFDAQQISYTELLDIFWKLHNPTTKNRQGADVGSQYRSAIFYVDKEQQHLAQSSHDEQQAHWPNPIVTEIVPFEHFWLAEEYHQQYIAKQRGRV